MLSDTKLSEIARKYDVSTDAAREVERALRASGGRQAQFSHPDLGGTGQWMPGMVMIGQMFNDALKARVAGLCADVADAVAGDAGSHAVTSRGAAEAADASRGPAAAWSESPQDWWPAKLGRPGASGSQNGVRYAYFPDARRLLVRTGDQVAAYDTGEHRIGGVSQQQGSDTKLAFTSQLGDVPLDKLRQVTAD